MTVSMCRSLQKTLFKFGQALNGAVTVSFLAYNAAPIQLPGHRKRQDAFKSKLWKQLIYHFLNSSYIVYVHNLFPCVQVGTGFSFTNNTLGLSTNEVEVANNLYSALTQFFTVFTSYQANDFYVIGEVRIIVRQVQT